MDYEEKYKAALERARALNDGKDVDVEAGTTTCEYIFPELKESEDEKIRKELMDFIYVTCFPVKDLKKKEKFLEWLEKQGERELENYDEAEKEKADFVGDGFIKCHADFLDFKAGNTYWLEYIGDDKYNVRSDNLLGKTYHITPCQLYTVFKKLTWLEKQREQSVNVEPKFHEGEWLQYRNAKPFFVEEITKQGYVNGISCLPFEWEDEIHLWTIQDAKDGDVLAYVTDEEDLWIMIYRSLYEPYEGHVHYHALLVNDNFSDKGTCCICIDNLKPATKEQRDLLFQRIADNGYDWDAEKKKLIKMKETKFKVGDWVVDDKTPNDVFCVIEVLEEIYKVIDIDGDDYHIPHCKADNQFHLWTIADAKDGDILAEHECLVLFKQINGLNIDCYCTYHYLGFNPSFHVNTLQNKTAFHPATKEQRDLFFEKMKEAGYEWDADKKELSKQTLKITPNFCVGQFLVDNNGNWYKITNVKCLDDWYYEVCDLGKDKTHLELCSIIDEKFS